MSQLWSGVTVPSDTKLSIILWLGSTQACCCLDEVDYHHMQIVSHIICYIRVVQPRKKLSKWTDVQIKLFVILKFGLLG